MNESLSRPLAPMEQHNRLLMQQIEGRLRSGFSAALDSGDCYVIRNQGTGVLSVLASSTIEDDHEVVHGPDSFAQCIGFVNSSVVTRRPNPTAGGRPPCRGTSAPPWRRLTASGSTNARCQSRASRSGSTGTRAITRMPAIAGCAGCCWSSSATIASAVATNERAPARGWGSWAGRLDDQLSRAGRWPEMAMRLGLASSGITRTSSMLSSPCLRSAPFTSIWSARRKDSLKARWAMP